MKLRLTLLALAWMILSCSGREQSTVDPALQEAADSILLDLYSEPPASAYAIVVDREGRILCWSFWEKPDGHLINDPYLFRPVGLFEPVVAASAMMDDVLAEEKFKMHVMDWFPHALSLIPINAPRVENSQGTFLGETMVVPAAELAAFYNAIAHGGLLATPRLTSDRPLPVRRIMPTHVADSLQKALVLSYSNMNESLGCLVAGQSGLTEIPMDNGQGLVSSFVGTFDLAPHGQITLLVAITFSSDDFRPEEKTQEVFEKMVSCFKNLPEDGK